MTCKWLIKPENVTDEDWNKYIHVCRSCFPGSPYAVTFDQIKAYERVVKIINPPKYKQIFKRDKN